MVNNDFKTRAKTLSERLDKLDKEMAEVMSMGQTLEQLEKMGKLAAEKDSLKNDYEQLKSDIEASKK